MGKKIIKTICEGMQPLYSKGIVKAACEDFPVHWREQLWSKNYLDIKAKLLCVSLKSLSAALLIEG